MKHIYPKFHPVTILETGSKKHFASEVFQLEYVFNSMTKVKYGQVC